MILESEGVITKEEEVDESVILEAHLFWENQLSNVKAAAVVLQQLENNGGHVS